MIQKHKCTNRNCNWTGYNNALLTAPNPFEQEETLYACPKCRDIESIVGCCEVDKCWDESTCGGKVHGVYKRVCGDHYRELLT